MNWDSIAGNWKQITGKVKESGASSPTTTSRKSTATASSSRARSRRATVTPKTRCRRTSTTGSAACRSHSALNERKIFERHLQSEISPPGASASGQKPLLVEVRQPHQVW